LFWDKESRIRKESQTRKKQGKAVADSVYTIPFLVASILL